MKSLCISLISFATYLCKIRLLSLAALSTALCLSFIVNLGFTDYARAAENHLPQMPIIDTHVHYKEPAWSVYPPPVVIKMMEAAGVAKALVSSTPDEGTRMLYREDPDRIIPFLRPYHDDVDSSNWHQNASIIDYFKERLEMPIYSGLGEFHIHNAIDADSPAIKETLRLAVERDLFIHVHSDHRAVESLFATEPKVKVLWAHAGMSDPPAVVSDMFNRFKNLWVDISIREYEIAPGGTLDAKWEKLFIDHSDRITIGSDTWVNSQWDSYAEIIAFDRQWLAQLPQEVAEKIAYRNAQQLFAPKSKMTE